MIKKMYLFTLVSITSWVSLQAMNHAQVQQEDVLIKDRTTQVEYFLWAIAIKEIFMPQLEEAALPAHFDKQSYKKDIELDLNIVRLTIQDLLYLKNCDQKKVDYALAYAQEYKEKLQKQQTILEQADKK